MKIDGLTSLEKKLARMPREAKAEIRKALDKSGDEMVATSRALAPVDEGALKGSIRKRQGAHELEVIVEAGGPDAPHAIFVEAGTENMSARPYFRPAFRSLRRRFRGRINRATTKAAKAVARGS